LFDLLAWGRAEHTAKGLELDESPLGRPADEAGGEDPVSLDEFFAKLGLM
jgi:hypothetical protein